MRGSLGKQKNDGETAERHAFCTCLIRHLKIVGIDPNISLIKSSMHACECLSERNKEVDKNRNIKAVS